MRMFRIFGIVLLVPENDTDRFLLDCTSRRTKAVKVNLLAADKKGGRWNGSLYCEYVKNCDAKFREWPRGHFMREIQERMRNAKSN